MSFEPLGYLRHILAEADYLAEQTAALRQRFRNGVAMPLLEFRHVSGA